MVVPTYCRHMTATRRETIGVLTSIVGNNIFFLVHQIFLSSSPLVASLALKEHQESLCLWLDGVRHFAILGPDGRRLSWADGDVWLRRERHDPELEEAPGEISRRDWGAQK